VDPTFGPAAFTQTDPVNGNGLYGTPVGFVANILGTWHWVAVYSGDANNLLVSAAPLAEPVVVLEEADLNLTKTVTPSQVFVGQNVQFTMIINNLGPDTATNVVVSDPLPPGLVFVSDTGSQGTYSPQSGIWLVGALGPGAGAFLTITVQVVVAETIANNATVIGSDEFDPDISNNQASAILTGINPPPPPNQQISKRQFLA
jgi:uncharacterized repeat protein (TIGR01451 family)